MEADVRTHPLSPRAGVPGKTLRLSACIHPRGPPYLALAPALLRACSDPRLALGGGDISR